ncbi:hypothetical protein HETIRDRAFT_480555 [Heterobasidion irregulare TC 32-1]|uniref:Protein FRA10AC1 n=1 Tax=Heterobasidion irregulare (strain TC 32-1) TaxID=747525 RepID=W4JSJ2_HETIT|nr:uncharacterized protein HETIRDRAFT_480555 [Heterobasidion irregulare TC 32-1]ETW76424.1 hypothetical protein HETIRDRAFT_480555 [Heterobasidion irregulare TC 32-1]
MTSYNHRTASGSASLGTTTEFEILRASHKFLREDDAENLDWNEQLARKYYSSLFREFALCDLKHYKTGNFALRWRTEGEVLSGAGETTCGNSRCRHHAPPDHDPDSIPSTSLKTLELPFAYEEHGEMKSALVKVVLCDKCCKKLMWKRNKEKEEIMKLASSSSSKEAERAKERKPPQDPSARGDWDERPVHREDQIGDRIGGEEEEKESGRQLYRHGRRSRSQSPTEKSASHRSHRRRSRSPRSRKI